MTICIAGIVESNKIIAITDKMITLGGNVATRYEIGENNKVIKLTEKSLALFAGNVIAANEIMAIAKTKIEAESNPTITRLATLFKESYHEHWKKGLNEQLLQRFNISLEVFVSNQRVLDQALVGKINEIILNANLGVEILVAGIDTQPHIFLIGNPGTIMTLDPIGYGLIGSGSQHAQLSMIENEYNSGISKENGLFALLEAKRRAEYDPGVGELCDIVIIDGGFDKLTEQNVNKITRQFEKTLNSIKRSKNNAAVKIYGHTHD